MFNLHFVAGVVVTLAIMFPFAYVYGRHGVMGVTGGLLVYASTAFFKHTLEAGK